MKFLFCLVCALIVSLPARSQTVETIPTRPGVTQKLLVLKASEPKATLILFPGGHGGLQLFPNGSMKWGQNNFLVRVRQSLVDQGFTVAIVDTTSDRQSPPFLQGFRQRPEHAADIKAVIAWARETSKVPVWLVGTSRGTQSVGYLATELAGADGPDGVILTATILVDDKGRPVPAMPLERIRIPVLVVHHEQDACAHCPFANAPQVIDKLKSSPKKQLVSVTGGNNTGDECEALAYHGFNGTEQTVVQHMAAWVAAK